MRPLRRRQRVWFSWAFFSSFLYFLLFWQTRPKCRSSDSTPRARCGAVRCGAARVMKSKSARVIQRRYCRSRLPAYDSLAAVRGLLVALRC